MANVCGTYVSDIGPRLHKFLRTAFDHCTNLPPVSTLGAMSAAQTCNHIGRDTPVDATSNAVGVAGWPCGGHLKRAAPLGAQPDLDE